jgi:hypothetical protein
VRRQIRIALILSRNPVISNLTYSLFGEWDLRLESKSDPDSSTGVFSGHVFKDILEIDEFPAVVQKC